MHYDMDGKPVDADTFYEKYGDIDARRVALDVTEHFAISTVLLTVNHEWRPDHPPLIFETMIFTRRWWDGDHDDDHDKYQERYRTKAEALVGHQAAVELARREGAAIPALIEFQGVIAAAMLQAGLR